MRRPDGHPSEILTKKLQMLDFIRTKSQKYQRRPDLFSRRKFPVTARPLADGYPDYFHRHLRIVAQLVYLKEKLRKSLRLLMLSLPQGKEAKREGEGNTGRGILATT